jgi:hypothetical protein
MPRVEPAADRPDEAVANLVAPVERAAPPVALPDPTPAEPAATPVTPGPAGPPSERAPQQARRRALAVERTAPSRRLRPGDLICGECGEGNAPARKFCSRCGNSLQEAERVKARWWHRLRRQGPKVVAISESGPASKSRRAPGKERHALRKVFRKIRVVGGVFVILAGVVYGTYPPFRNLINGKVNSVKQVIGKKVDQHFVPERPVTVKANLSAKGHPGRYATDGFTNTYWAAPFALTNYPTLTLTFDHRVTLERMIINLGAGDDFTAHGRPSLIVLVYSNKQSSTLTPQDTPKAQTLNLNHAIGITSVQIQVEGNRPGSAASDVAISNIELFGID